MIPGNLRSRFGPPKSRNRRLPSSFTQWTIHLDIGVRVAETGSTDGVERRERGRCENLDLGRERGLAALGSGANLSRILVDPADDPTDGSRLFLITHESKFGDRSVLSKRFQSVRFSSEGEAHRHDVRFRA